MFVLNSIQQFLTTGGQILWVIFGVSICLWYLIAAKLIYLNMLFIQKQSKWVKHWEDLTDKNSWSAMATRELILSKAKINLTSTVSTIKILIGLCPLLGLLGTVTGMINVFDVMAVSGTGSARSIADGVSKATIPTMAGMVIAIAGLYFSKLIEDKVNEHSHNLTDLLRQ